MSKVLQWFLIDRLRIQTFCLEKQFAFTLGNLWWLLSIVIQKQLFEEINVTYLALKIDAVVLFK